MTACMSCEAARERGLGQALLAPEVVMQQRLVDAGFGGDLLHAGARRPPAKEDVVRRVENARLGRPIPLGGPPRALL